MYFVTTDELENSRCLISTCKILATLSIPFMRRSLTPEKTVRSLVFDKSSYFYYFTNLLRGWSAQSQAEHSLFLLMEYTLACYLWSPSFWCLYLLPSKTTSPLYKAVESHILREDWRLMAPESSLLQRPCSHFKSLTLLALISDICRIGEVFS